MTTGCLRLSLAFCLAAAALSGSVSIGAQNRNPSNFDQLPDPQQLAMQFGDAPNRAEVLARRAGVLSQMPGVVVAFAAAEGRSEAQLTPLERRVIADYRTFGDGAWEGVQKEVGTDRARLTELERYKTDRNLLIKVLSDLASPALAARYRAIADGAVTTAPAAAAAPASASRRPAGPANAVLTIVAPLAVSSGDTLYLLDDDLEKVLTAAGFQRQVVMGQQLSVLQSLEVVSRMKAQQSAGSAAILEAFGGGGALAAFGLDFAESARQYDIASRAITAHTVATTRAAAGAPVRFVAVPAGTYWVWTTHQQDVTTGAQGTIVGSTVTLTPTGYQRAIVWNLKTTLNAGANSVSLTQANAAFSGQ